MTIPQTASIGSKIDLGLIEEDVSVICVSLVAAQDT